MTLLIISPDYASHLLPLAALGTAWHEANEHVVVATGEATASIVESFGFDRVHLQLGRGSNPGVIRAEEQPTGEDDALRGFFEATRRGMVETLRFQAEARLTDLMWQPVETARAVLAVIEQVQPTEIIVDHLAFSARLAMDAAGLSYADVVLGHPTALPVGAEVYGYPPVWPAAFTPSSAVLAELRALCTRVSENFTAEWNAALAELNPAHPASPNAFGEHGELLLLNYPAELAAPERAPFLPKHQFIGSTVRDEPRDDEVERWLAASSEPFVYLSFGSFLSVRDDVLGRVCAALRALDLRAAIATGSADAVALGPLPPKWLVRGFLPQVRLLQSAAAAVTHGGNNSVTEAMTYGIPLVVLPFSTDQFAGAEAVERKGFGIALEPNTATVDELVAAIEFALNLPGEPRARLEALSAELIQVPGRVKARSGFESLRTN